VVAMVAAESREHKALTCTIACVLLLVVGALAHLWYVTADCPLDIAPDEASYWDWARRPALSYDDQAPMVAWLIAGSRWLLADLSMQRYGTEALAVRMPAIVLALLTGLGIYVFALDVLRRPGVALAAVALTFTIPVFVAGSMITTVDAPLTLAWIWALVCAHRALARRSLLYWILTGLVIAFGILSKFNMVLLFPAVGLTILTESAYRPMAKRPGPYLATFIGFLGFVPILIWNAHHDWAHFRFVTRQSGVTGAWGIDLLGPFAMIGGQLAIIGPLWLTGMVIAVVQFWRRPRVNGSERHDPPALRLLLFATATPWAVFLAFSPLTKIQPNWPVASVLTGTILLAAWLARLLQAAEPATRRWTKVFIAAGLLFGGTTSIVMHRTEWLMPAFGCLTRNAPPWDLTPVSRFDPTARMRGWRQLGEAVGEVMSAQRDTGRDPFIMADTYQLASELAFYVPGQPSVYSAQSVIGTRGSMYDIWENPIRDAELFIGRPCIYVGRLHPILTGEDGHDAALPGMRPVRTVEHFVRGQRVQIWTIYLCDVFAGFPETGEAKAE
jgi:undecaprenyl-diphosphatase